MLFEEHSTSRTMPYLFNGKELDTETGLYYYGARYYDPRVSIFLNVDPLTEKTMTPYAYTNNNPINLIDPTGMKPEDWYEGADGKIVWFEGNGDRKGFKYAGNSVKRGDLHYAANGNVYDDSPEGAGRIDNSKKIMGIEEVVITAPKKDSPWNSNLRRLITGDKVGFSVGVDATAFLGVSISFDFDWILTGSDASVFPYFGVSTGANIADGFNGSVDFSVNKAWFTGPSSEVKASDLPGTSYGASMGIKAITGGEIGYSYSKSGKYGWHQVQGGIGGGLEFSPATAVTIKGSVSQQWFNIHTKTGKVNYAK